MLAADHQPRRLEEAPLLLSETALAFYLGLSVMSFRRNRSLPLAQHARARSGRARRLRPGSNRMSARRPHAVAPAPTKPPLTTRPRPALFWPSGRQSFLNNRIPRPPLQRADRPCRTRLVPMVVTRQALACGLPVASGRARSKAAEGPCWVPLV